MDKRVEIHGTSRADMNGKRGVATDFHPMGGNYDRTKDRYTVQLDGGGESFKLKPANVRAEDALCGAEKSPEKLFELALNVKSKISWAVDPSQTHSWPPLSPSQQEEMDGAIVMFQEAMDQVGERACVRFDSRCHAELTLTISPNRPPPPPGPHPRSSGHRRHLLLGQRRGDRLPAGDGGVQDRCRGG